jgi:arylsulfatase A-like enzyme
MGIGDISAYNPDSKIPTINLDRLAREGMRFTDMHSPSAVCTPTRYGLLTGRYAWRTRLQKGVLVGDSPSLIELGRSTLASLLKAHGYQTSVVGKWHLGLGDNQPTDYTRPLKPSPLDYGFDYFYGIPASLDMQPYLYVENDQAVEKPTQSIEASAHRREGGGGFWRAGAVAPGFRHEEVLPKLGQKAAELIQKADANRPLFLYLALTAPHTPWLPLEEFRGSSKAGYYGDFCVQVDSVVGQVLDALKSKGYRDNTMVFFTSDNGSHWPESDIDSFNHRANHIYRGQKADIWEGGHRVPFIVRWPGFVQANSTNPSLACLTDIFATLTELLGERLEEDEAEDSFSFAGTLLGSQASAERAAVVHHSFNGTFAIREGAWKLVLGRGSGGFTQPVTLVPKPGEPEGQLYRLDEDPAETDNLYLKELQVVARLSALLNEYREKGRSRN